MKPARMTNRRWRRIQRRRRERQLWRLLQAAFVEIRRERQIERAIREFRHRWDAGEVPPLTVEQEQALEAGRVKLMARFRYFQAEGVWPA